MIDGIKKYILAKQQDYTFSILIPSWNNLNYLKNCIESINQHSTHLHQIIVFVNEGSDGTLEWLHEQSLENLDYIYSLENIGICYGMNMSRSLVRSDYILYMNDDMYALPGWDLEIYRAIAGLGTKLFMLSSTMIEPVDTGNKCVVVKDYGSDLDSFEKKELLKNFQSLKRPNWQGSTWPPVVIHVESWDLVGGFSTEFSPGMYSDPDFSFKLLRAGVREFIGIGSSLVYHFGSKSTNRIQKNRGRQQFLAKWGISSGKFRKELLKIGDAYSGPLQEPDFTLQNKFFQRLKKSFSSWRPL